MSEPFADRFDPLVAKIVTRNTLAAPYTKMLGIEVVSLEPGRITCRLAVEPKLDSGIGVTHGGAIVSLVDHALSLVVYPLVDRGRWAATQEFKVNFLEAVTSGTLEARGQVLHLEDPLGSVQVDVWNGERLVATAMGTVFITAPRDREKHAAARG